MRRRADDRGQAIQVGAVILFGFLVIAFSGYQAVSVPSQNQAIEFQHSMQVTDQMQEFRSDVIEASSTGTGRSQAFKLGTSYPVRVFAVNPAPASGRLSTTSFGGGEYVLDAPSASLESICGLSEGDGPADDVPSKALVYEPNYNEYTQAPDVVYENTVTYRRFPGETRLDSGQNLVDGTTLTLTPLVGDVSEATSVTRTVDLSPGKAGIGWTNNESVTLTVPTALDDETWEDLLSDEPQVTGVSENTTSGGVDIELASAEYTVVCPVVGLETTPDNNPDDEIQRDGDGSSDLNPGDPGEVRLSDIQRDSTDKDIIVATFTNPGDEVDLTSARFNFYSDDNGHGPDVVDILNYSDYQSGGSPLIDGLELRGETLSPSPTQTFANGNTKVALRFEDDSGVLKTGEGDIAVLSMRFSDGQDSLYFFDMPKNSDTSNGGDGGNGGNAAADNVSFVSGSEGTFWGTDGVEFKLQNDGSTDAIVEQLTVDTTAGSAKQLSETNGGTDSQGQHEVFIDATDSGRLEPATNPNNDAGTPYEIGTQADLRSLGSSQSATIGSGTEATVSIYGFEKNNGGSVDVSGEDVTVTIYYSDGSSKSYTFTVP